VTQATTASEGLRARAVGAEREAARLERLLAGLEGERSSLTAQVRELAEARLNAIAALEASQQAGQGLRRDAERLRVALEGAEAAAAAAAAARDGSGAEAAKLRGSTAVLQAEAASLQAQLDALQAKYRDTEAAAGRFSFERSQMERMQPRLESLQAEVQRLHATASSQEAQLASAVAELERSRAAAAAAAAAAARTAAAAAQKVCACVSTPIDLLSRGCWRRENAGWANSALLDDPAAHSDTARGVDAGLPGSLD
jgi:chromosome segregation ATPase